MTLYKMVFIEFGKFMNKFKLLLAIFLTVFLTACTSSAQAIRIKHFNPNKSYQAIEKDIYVVNDRKYTTNLSSSPYHYEKTGQASYYHKKFNGRQTASGDIYDDAKFTAAHRTLPIGTYVLVTNLRNDRKVVVRINDRGPFAKSRIIDLSKIAAAQIGMIASGTANVKVEKLHLIRN